jgi:hypothetical protein
MREEHRLKVFKNRELRRIFGRRNDEVTWEWRRLHSKELYVLYFSLDIRVIKSRMRWAGHVARMGQRRCFCSVLEGKNERRKPLGRSRGKWGDIIKIYL